MAPEPINMEKNRKIQPTAGMINKIPIMIVPVIKGHKKRAGYESLKAPRTFLPIHSPTYTRLI